jgi:hypothetical protein
LNIQYSQVCGLIRAYQYRLTDAFALGRNHTIDGPYVDGVSLTHGNPKQHIWTFAAAYYESSGLYGCPCLNGPFQTHPSNQPPDFIGNDYFCDTGATSIPIGTFYPDTLCGMVLVVGLRALAAPSTILHGSTSSFHSPPLMTLR